MVLLRAENVKASKVVIYFQRVTTTTNPIISLQLSFANQELQW